MNLKAIALLSGGLDSMLAIAIVKEQGIEIEAVNFQTMFGCCKEDARRAAYDLGVKFSVLKVGDDYLKVIQKPKYGYGRGVNPCVDCRIYMFLAAKQYMEEAGASFMITGEVVDQRPMSQKVGDLRIIDRDCGLEGKILRPLSAKLLPETEAERLGLVDRSKLYDIHGEWRKPLLDLAVKYGIENPPAASAGCALTSPDFAKKVRDVFRHHKDYNRWEFEILKIGRHFRLNSKTKAVISRNHTQNEYLENLRPAGTALLTCGNFGGPHALVIGPAETAEFEKAAGLMLRYSKKPLPVFCEIAIRRDGHTEIMSVPASQIEEQELERLRIV